MKRIVVPTDFSDCAMSALKVAAKIADKLNARICLVHTYVMPVYGFTSGHVMIDGEQLGKIKSEVKNEMARIASMDFIKKYEVERMLLADYSVDQIVEQKDLANADLIVMGTHGASGMKELIGSNTEKVIRKAKCPVLAIREGAEKNFNPKNIVFASTFFGEVYDRFERIHDFARMFDAKIHLLHVNTPRDFMTTEFSENLMNSFKEKFNLKNATINIYNDETVEDGVLHFSHRIKADMVAIETHGRTGVNHILNGSIAEDLANHINIPLLTFRINKVAKPTGVIFPEMR